jgi:hypothetical protein
MAPTSPRYDQLKQFTQVQVQVQVCFTSVCGQVQPLDVALSNSVQHSHAIAVPGCLSVLAGKLCTNEAKGAAKPHSGALIHDIVQCGLQSGSGTDSIALVVMEPVINAPTRSAIRHSNWPAFTQPCHHGTHAACVMD